MSKEIAAHIDCMAKEHAEAGAFILNIRMGSLRDKRGRCQFSVPITRVVVKKRRVPLLSIASLDNCNSLARSSPFFCMLCQHRLSFLRYALVMGVDKAIVEPDAATFE